VPSTDYGTAQSLTERLESRLTESLAADVDRRTVLGGLGAAGAMAVGAGAADASPGHGGTPDHHGKFGAVGEYESTESFDPHAFLRDFRTGEVTQESGETVRTFELRAIDTTIEIAPGVEFPAWTFEGQVPGPTLRAEEGELIRIRFANGSSHAHTIHPHLKNLNPNMDGIPQNGPGVLDSGQSFTYEWRAQPAGCHFYHCHSLPLKEHIHRGLYGALIVDPDPERVREQPADYVPQHATQITPEFEEDLVARARSRNQVNPEYEGVHEYTDHDGVDELVMVMNGFDTNFDGDNEVYAANTRAFAYGVGSTDGKGNWEPGGTKRPIQVDKNELVRVYLLNLIEFDLVNSFHSHSQFFDYYDHGTTLTPTHQTVDTVMQCQAQRGIIDLDYADHEPGLYMFHAHQSEFAELGWMSFFEVV
jgi:FtsP/CotA-like multicopper oxidase with cupredoxin domain